MSNTSRLRRAAIVLCFIPAAYFALTALYALFRFDEFAADLPRLMRYVLGPLLISTLLMVFAVMLRPDNALMAGIIACSILLALFIFEGYLRWQTLPQRVGLTGVMGEDEDTDRYVGAMPPAYTIKGMNAQLGAERLSDAILSATPNAEMLLCSRMGEPVTTRTDRFGFRNPQPLPAPPVDIMVLGDSFAEGICLADGEHFVDRMREGGVSITNTASRGAGPLYELAVLGRFGPYFRPRVTLFAFFEGNDWENLEREQSEPWLREALGPGAEFGPVDMTETQRDLAQNKITDWWQGSAATVQEFFRRRSFLRNVLALQQTAVILGLHYPKAAADNPLFLQILNRASDMTALWQGKVIVVYIPSLDRFGGVFPHDFVTDPLREKVRTASDDAGVGFIDLTPVFDGSDNPLSLYAPDSHLSVKGAELAAQTIMADSALMGALDRVQ